MPTLFNGCGCGPPPPLTAASTWSWIGHPVSGLCIPTIRAFHTWFPFGSGPEALSLACIHSSPDRSTKSTRSASRPSAACRHRVSGSLSLPSRGPFHLSLTVLFSIGHWVVFSLTEWSPLIHTAFLVFRATLDTVCFGQLSHTGVSPSLPGLSSAFLLASLLRPTVRTPKCMHFGLGSSAFDRLYLRNRFSFSSSAYLDVSVQRVPFRTLWIHVRMTESLPPGFPIQTSADRSLCAAPRSFSQLITSFVGSQCQGIRPAPFLA